MLFLDVAPRDTTRVYRFRAERGVITSWARALEARVRALSTQNDRGVLISKGARSIKEDPTASNTPPKRAYVNLDAAGQPIKQQLSPELHEQDLRIEERAVAIERLESDMMQVNGMFQDLAGMVLEQGQGLDRIDSHLGTVQHRVEAGMSDLDVANKRC